VKYHGEGEEEYSDVVEVEWPSSSPTAFVTAVFG
jgi:hypothetical protein